MKFVAPQIVGVVNITRDSFSDGGHYLDTDKAIPHAEKLLLDGADILDLGAAASNPRAEHVPAEKEIERLAPVVKHLKHRHARISIDTTKTEVQRWAIGEGVEFLNDIRGFPDPLLYPELAASNAKLIVMHFIRPPQEGVGQASDLDKAVREPKQPQEVLESIHSFFTARLAQLRAAGIDDDRLIIDPGMGFFLASNPEPSLAVLAHLSELQKEFGLPLMIGVSRKSFLRNIPGIGEADIQTRTLAAELYAAEQGASYIRTHDVRAIREGLHTVSAIHSVLSSSY